jgi:lipid-A-disaccharide synthase
MKYLFRFVWTQTEAEKPIQPWFVSSQATYHLFRFVWTRTEAKNDFQNYQFVIAAMQLTKEWISKQPLPENVKIVFDATYDLLHHAEAALVTSGTATLETALLNVPQICCYKTSGITYTVGKMLVNIQYISLVNLILEKEAIKELIQNYFSQQNLKSELQKILIGGDKRETIIKDYNSLKNILSTAGALKKAAELIVEFSL